jgi:D-3-phosphoglycerate dehydrogenase
MNKKVLLSPSSFAKLSSAPLDLLQKNNYEIVENPFGRRLNEDEVLGLLKGCIGLVGGVEPITKKVLEHSSLKCISRVGVGLDNIDLKTASDLGIGVLNTPDGPTDSVAEFTLGLTLSLLKRIPEAHKNLSNGVWKKETGSLLKGKIVGVIGMGRIGRKVAEMFRGLGNKVVGFDLNEDHDWANKYGVRYETFENVLKESDVLTIHVPYIKEKGEIISSSEFDLMKNGAYLINASRGKVVNEVALKNVLDSGKLAGAAVDVFDEEPYSGVLKKCDNVVLTPHIGSYSKEGKIQMEIDSVQNLINYLNDSKL